MARRTLSAAGRPAFRTAGRPAWALLLVAASGCGGGGLDEAQRAARLSEMVEEVRRDFPDVATVTPEQLDRLLADSGEVVLVDVRTDEERLVSMIPGAISRAQFEREYDRSDGHRVVAYCTVGVRSSQFVRELADLGINAWNLEEACWLGRITEDPSSGPGGQRTAFM